MTPPFAVRRLLIGLDASPAARAALSAALRLAARLEAEAESVFVQDARLLDIGAFGGLPIGHVSAATGRAEAIDARAMEAGLRAQADRLGRETERLAATLRRSCRLRALRGPVAATLVAAAATSDLLIVGSRARHVGAVLEATIQRASTSVLVLPGGRELGHGAVAILARDRQTLDRALAAAALLSGGDGRAVDLWLGADLAETDARAAAAALGFSVRIAVAAPIDAASLADRLAPDAAVAILAGDDPLLADGGLRAFLRQTGAPTLLLRPAPNPAEMQTPAAAYGAEP